MYLYLYKCLLVESWGLGIDLPPQSNCTRLLLQFHLGHSFCEAWHANGMLLTGSRSLDTSYNLSWVTQTNPLLQPNLYQCSTFVPFVGISVDLKIWNRNPEAQAICSSLRPHTWTVHSIACLVHTAMHSPLAGGRFRTTSSLCNCINKHLCHTATPCNTLLFEGTILKNIQHHPTTKKSMGHLHNFSATLPCLANQVQVSSNTGPETLRFSRFGILLLQRISSLSSLWLISWQRKWDKRTKDEVIKKLDHIYIMWNLHIESTRISFFQIFWEKKLYKLPISPLSATQTAILIASVGPIERYKPQSFGNKNCDEIDSFIQGAAPMKKYLNHRIRLFRENRLLFSGCHYVVPIHRSPFMYDDVICECL